MPVEDMVKLVMVSGNNTDTRAVLRFNHALSITSVCSQSLPPTSDPLAIMLQMSDGMQPPSPFIFILTKNFTFLDKTNLSIKKSNPALESHNWLKIRHL